MSAADRQTGTDPRTPSTPETTAFALEGESKLCPVLEALSNWQAVIIVMAANGRTNHQISLRLKIPVSTVEQYLREARDILRLPAQQDLNIPVISAHLSRTSPLPGRGDAHRDDTRGMDASRQPEALERTPQTQEFTPGPAPAGPVPPWLSRLEGQLKDTPGLNSLVAMDAAEAVHDAVEASQAPVPISSEDPDNHPDQDAAPERAVAAAFELLQQQREIMERVEKAVRNRDVIGQAKGILMERHKISSEAAFTILQDESTRTDRDVAELAAQVISSDR